MNMSKRSPLRASDLTPKDKQRWQWNSSRLAIQIHADRRFRATQGSRSEQYMTSGDIGKLHPGDRLIIWSIISQMTLIHLLHHILSVQAGFSANRKEKAGWGNIRAIRCCGMHLNREISIFFELPLPCEPLHPLYESKSSICDFWNWAAFSEQVD
jgi:hypothetical protein